MEIFVHPAARIMLYMVTVCTIGVFMVSVHRERRRMLNCILLIVSLVLIWSVITVIGGFVYGQDVQGLISLPLIVLGFLSAILLIGNGVVVIRKEGVSFAHSLSLLAGIGVLLVLAFDVGILIYAQTRVSITEMAMSYVLVAAFRVFMQIVVYLPLMTIGFTLYSVLYQRLPIRYVPDYVVVLGCGLSGDKVTPLLASRLNRGLEFDRKRGGKSEFVVSGGQGSDEKVSEACAMKRYLLAEGIPAERIIMEDRSTSTRENLLFSKQIMERQKKEYRCVFVTNNFHVLRAAILAKSIGLKGEVLGGKTAGYYHPVAAIREYVALIFAYRNTFFLYLLWVLVLGILNFFMGM